MKDMNEIVDIEKLWKEHDERLESTVHVNSSKIESLNLGVPRIYFKDKILRKVMSLVIFTVLLVFEVIELFENWNSMAHRITYGVLVLLLVAQLVYTYKTLIKLLSLIQMEKSSLLQLQKEVTILNKMEKHHTTALLVGIPFLGLVEFFAEVGVRSENLWDWIVDVSPSLLIIYAVLFAVSIPLRYWDRSDLDRAEALLKEIESIEKEDI